MSPVADWLPAVFRTDQPLVFAHRGGARLAPENTMVAFDNGMTLGADGLELDVRLSADGVPVVIHDPTLDRTTNRVGPVSALTAAELAEVDAGHHFGADRGYLFRGRGQGVPRLDEVLARHPHARAIVEMKESGAALARSVVEVVRRLGAIDRVCAGSFHSSAVHTVRALEPRLATSASLPEVRGTLHRAWVRWPFAAARPYAALLVPQRAGRVRVASRAFVRQAHRGGHVVQVWVVDAPADVARLLDWGVDGVITDRPDLAIAARDEWVAAVRGRRG